MPHFAALVPTYFCLFRDSSRRAGTFRYRASLFNVGNCLPISPFRFGWFARRREHLPLIQFAVGRSA